jgi:hypothetical protein
MDGDLICCSLLSALDTAAFVDLYGKPSIELSLDKDILPAGIKLHWARKRRIVFGGFGIQSIVDPGTAPIETPRCVLNSHGGYGRLFNVHSYSLRLKTTEND